MLRILYDDFDQKVKNIHDEMDLHHSYKYRSHVNPPPAPSIPHCYTPRTSPPRTAYINSNQIMLALIFSYFLYFSRAVYIFSKFEN